MIKRPRIVTCSACQGTGEGFERVDGHSDCCSVCGGDGFLKFRAHLAYIRTLKKTYNPTKGETLNEKAD